MAQIDLGKLKFTWKGTWTTQTAYEIDDVVEFEGTTFIVVSDVPSNNTTSPKENAAFTIMAQGLAFKGAFSASITYLKGDVVTYSNQTFVLLAGSFNGTNSSAVPTNGTTWMLLTPAPENNVLTTSGDIVVRDKDNTTDYLLELKVKFLELRKRQTTTFQMIQFCFTAD